MGKNLYESEKLLPEETANLLAKYYKEPSLELRDKIVCGNLAFANYMASTMHVKNHYEFEDYLSRAYIGLIKAVETFDPTFKVSFTTYAGEVIMNSMLRAYKVQRRYNERVMSLDEDYSNDDRRDSFNMQKIISSSENVEADVLKNENIKNLHKALSLLPMREEDVVKYLYFKDQKQVDIDKYDFNHTSIGYIKTSAKNRILKMLEWNFTYAAIFNFEENIPDKIINETLSEIPERTKLLIFASFGLKGFKKLNEEQITWVFSDGNDKESRRNVMTMLSTGLNSIEKKATVNYKNKNRRLYSGAYYSVTCEKRKNILDLEEIERRLIKIKCTEEQNLKNVLDNYPLNCLDR